MGSVVKGQYIHNLNKVKGGHVVEVKGDHVVEVKGHHIHLLILALASQNSQQLSTE